MDQADLVHKRKSKYMAQMLEALEETVILTMPIPATAASAYRADRDAMRPGDLDDVAAQQAFQRTRRSAFQTHVEPHMARSAVEAIQGFKALARQYFNALARDAVEILTLDTVPNGVAIDMRDSLSPVGRP